jgi:hypothetical protein
MAMRIKIHKDGTATLSGINYDTLRSVITAASLHHYDEEKAAVDKPEVGELADIIRRNNLANRAWRSMMRKSLDALDAAMRSAIEATHPRRKPPTIKQRKAAVMEKRRIRTSIDMWVREHFEKLKAASAA